MYKQAYIEGFIKECEFRKVNPKQLIKSAGMWDTTKDFFNKGIQGVKDIAGSLPSAGDIKQLTPDEFSSTNRPPSPMTGLYYGANQVTKGRLNQVDRNAFGDTAPAVNTPPIVTTPPVVTTDPATQQKYQQDFTAKTKPKPTVSDKVAPHFTPLGEPPIWKPSKVSK